VLTPPSFHRFALPVCLLTVTLMSSPIATGTDKGFEPPLRVAVAANFRGAALALASRFTQETGIEVTFSSGASGLLAAQILEGAPFDLFLSADEAKAAAVLGRGQERSPPVCYAQGSLALLGAKNLEDALADPDLSIAIANPRSAPYGAAALTVLQRPGFAGPDQRRVVQGANVQQALQFFERGATRLALVARAIAPQGGLPVPQDWHPPIEQFAAVVARGERAGAASAFLTFLTSKASRRFLGERGYGPCP